MHLAQICCSIPARFVDGPFGIIKLILTPQINYQTIPFLLAGAKSPLGRREEYDIPTCHLPYPGPCQGSMRCRRSFQRNMGIETNDTRMSCGYVHLSHVMAHSVPLQFAPYIFHALSMQATLGFNTSL